MSTLDGPGPFDGVDQESLSAEEWSRRLEAWFNAGLAEERARLGRDLIPGVDYSEVKARDIMGSAEARGMHDYRRDREEQARREQEREQASGGDEGSEEA